MVEPVLIDIANLQWWQQLFGIIAIIGLSPAPWLLGVATGRIQFTAPAAKNYAERTAELKAAQALTLEEKDKTHSASMAELVKHHTELRNIDAARYEEMKASRDGYRTATKEQRARADAATEAVGRAVEAVDTMNHFLSSLDQVINEPEDSNDSDQ